MLLSALSVCPALHIFFLLYACIFLCLSLYFVSFVLLFDVGVLGLHFLCAQRVFIVCVSGKEGGGEGGREK